MEADKDLRRKTDDLSDGGETTESSQRWTDELEFENLEESELSLDMEESLSIIAIAVSIRAEGGRRHVRNAVAAMDPNFSTIDNRADMAGTTNIELKFDSFQMRKSGPLRLFEVYQTKRRVE